MKISVQEKIAELESRIAALEAKQGKRQAVTVTRVDLEPEWGGLWKSFDALMKKAFK